MSSTRTVCFGWSMGIAGLMIPLLIYSIAQWMRPLRTPVAGVLFAGITYQRKIAEQPWPQVIHIVTIDLSQAELAVLVSPGTVVATCTEAAEFETTALTTSDFLAQNNLALAINANFFAPFSETTPWNFYPGPGDDTRVLGTAISDGVPYSLSESERPALCFGLDNRAQIASEGTCPPDTQQAIAGKQQLVWDGAPVPIEEKDTPYARVMAAVNQQGDRLWLVIVDGKQPGYSEGATLAQLTQIALRLEAAAAINLDGGGSTTLAIATPQGPRALNAPIHTKLPMRQRPVANHLGFRAARTE
ncbi:MAG: phosphodiester glycosidase family protein [Cyanobacteria bacterium P01_D01_bin.115]